MSYLTPTPDQDLLRRIANRDGTALGEFYDCHAGTLSALALRILNDPKEVEDTLQEVFLRVWDKASAYDPALGRPLAWVIALTRNRAIDRLRSAQRRARLVEEAVSEAVDDGASSRHRVPESMPLSDETELLRVAMARLPEEQRRAIEMAFFNGLTQTEIAVALNEPLGTVKARIRRGMLKLREELQPHLSQQSKAEPPETIGC